MPEQDEAGDGWVQSRMTLQIYLNSHGKDFRGGGVGSPKDDTILSIPESRSPSFLSHMCPSFPFSLYSQEPHGMCGV